MTRRVAAWGWDCLCSSGWLEEQDGSWTMTKCREAAPSTLNWWFNQYNLLTVNHPPVCDMSVLPLLPREGVPPFPDAEFGCTCYLVRNSTSGSLHPPTGGKERRRGQRIKGFINSTIREVMHIDNMMTPNSRDALHSAYRFYSRV